MTASLNASSFIPQKGNKPPTAPAPASNSGLGLDNVEANNDFTPSTPYVHKFRTEICKNFELYGKCKYGIEVSISKIKFVQIIFNFQMLFEKL